ncbi:MAG: 4-hydroxy-tetrahydrodipicolinate synthase [Oligoflexia bacterium]|nr:4-hydroxy-tetrahydrodipicolinate synthase [Oligoflexia bacterium]
MGKNFFTGISTALITPFKNAEVDFSSLKKLIKFQLDSKIQGFVVLGSTAESATLTLNEKQSIVDFVISEVAGQVPIVVGTGTNNTAESCALTAMFDKKNISGFLLVTPYYNKPPQRGLLKHFKQISTKTQKPVILYNVPSRTVISIDVDTTLKKLTSIKNICGIKEASGDLKIIKKIINKKFNNFSVISGDDETFPDAMGLGADGVISVVSHIIPKQCLNYKKDKKLIVDVSKALFVESNPIPVKYALFKMGIISHNELRLPLVSLDKKLHKNMDQMLKKWSLL